MRGTFATKAWPEPDWVQRPFSFFNRPEPCPVCGVPLTVTLDLLMLVWTVVHGEVPLLCWKDEWLGDKLVLTGSRAGRRALGTFG